PSRNQRVGQDQRVPSPGALVVVRVGRRDPEGLDRGLQRRARRGVHLVEGDHVLGDSKARVPERFFAGGGGSGLDSSEDRNGEKATEDEGETQGFDHGVSLLRFGQDWSASRNPIKRTRDSKNCSSVVSRNWRNAIPNRGLFQQE